MIGKRKCEILKSIRKTIADMNGIKYKPTPCNHEGDCLGTCPRCDKESEWLMAELRKKEAAGSSIRIDVESIEELENVAMEPIDEEEETLLGDIIPPEFETMGIMSAPLEILQDDVCDDDNDNDNEDEIIDGEQFLKENETSINAMCNGCIRFNTIMATDKGVRCSCLSEHFFLGMLEKKSCSLKR